MTGKIFKIQPFSMRFFFFFLSDSNLFCPPDVKLSQVCEINTAPANVLRCKYVKSRKRQSLAPTSVLAWRWRRVTATRAELKRPESVLWWFVLPQKMTGLKYSCSHRQSNRPVSLNERVARVRTSMAQPHWLTSPPPPPPHSLCFTEFSLWSTWS